MFLTPMGLKLEHTFSYHSDNIECSHEQTHIHNYNKHNDFLDVYYPAQLAESARESLRADSDLDEATILERYPELDVEEMKAFAIRVDFSWMVMTLCFPVGIMLILNIGPIARSRRDWVRR